LESKDFAFYSANLGHFIPSIPFREHGNLFQESCTHQYQSMQEQNEDQFPSTIRFIYPEEPFLEKPSIIATFHTGSYRLLSPCLASQGVGHVLVLTKDVLLQQGATFTEIIKRISP